MSRTWAQRVVAGGPERRLLVALSSASIAAWATLWLILHVNYGIDRVERGGPVLDFTELKASFFLILFWPVVAAPTIIFGSIVHSTLQFFGIQRWYYYALAGCLVGFIVGLTLLSLSVFSFTYEYERQYGCEYQLTKLAEALPLALIFGGLPGFTAALAFWAMLRSDRL